MNPLHTLMFHIMKGHKMHEYDGWNGESLSGLTITSSSASCFCPWTGKPNKCSDSQFNRVDKFDCLTLDRERGDLKYEKDFFKEKDLQHKGILSKNFLY